VLHNQSAWTDAASCGSPQLGLRLKATELDQVGVYLLFDPCAAVLQVLKIKRLSTDLCEYADLIFENQRPIHC